MSFGSLFKSILEQTIDAAGKSSKNLDGVVKTASKFADGVDAAALGTAHKQSSMTTFLKKLFGVARKDELILNKKMTGDVAGRIANASESASALYKAMQSGNYEVVGNPANRVLQKAAAGKSGVKFTNDEILGMMDDMYSGGLKVGDEELGDVFGVYKKSVKSLGIGTDNFKRSKDFVELANNEELMSGMKDMAGFGNADAWGMSLQSLFANKSGNITPWSIAKGVARRTAPIWVGGLTYNALKTPERLVDKVTEKQVREGKL